MTTRQSGYTSRRLRDPNPHRRSLLCRKNRARNTVVGIAATQRPATEVVCPVGLKHGRRTALTDAGRAFALSAVEVEVALARAEQAVARFQSESVGTVSVAAFDSRGHTGVRRLIR